MIMRFSALCLFSLSFFGHRTMLICPHASFLCVACCKGCRHSNVFHVAVINMLIFLISHLKPAVPFSFTHFQLFPSPTDGWRFDRNSLCVFSCFGVIFNRWVAYQHCWIPKLCPCLNGVVVVMVEGRVEWERTHRCCHHKGTWVRDLIHTS